RLRFSNDTDEHGEVGAYSVNGTDSVGNQILSELGATTRGGVAEFTFPAGAAAANVFLKPSQHNNSNNYASALTVDTGSGIVYARSTNGNFCSKGNRYTVYVAMKFDQAWSAFGTWNGNSNSTPVADRAAVVNSAAGGNNNHLGGYFSFPTSPTDETVVRVAIAMSYVSYDNARLNLEAEIPTLDASTLGAVRAAARAEWNSYLGKIRVSEPLASGQTPSGDPTRDLKAFYTSFYHAITHPSTFSDVNGEYPGFETGNSANIQAATVADRAPVVHNVSEKPGAGGRTRIQYSSFSDWDTYRCQAALVAAFWPDIASDQVQSLVNAAEQSGSYPQWTVANSTTNQMTGDNVPPLIVSTYAMGARDFDTATALEYMIEGAVGPNAGSWTGGTNPNNGNNLPMVERPGANLYSERGYAPQARFFQADHAVSGASYTQEYSLDDFAIAEFAAALGDQATAEQFKARSHYWQNLFNPTTNFIQPRDYNGFYPEGNAMAQYTFDQTNQNQAAFGWTYPSKQPDGFGQVGFDEGNAEQYLWFEPQNIAALVDMLGGKAAVSTRLDSFVTYLKVGPQVDYRGGPYMFAGNEPTFGVPWIYNYIGQAWKSSQLIDRMTQTIFGYGPADAAPGNDDLGAQSSWLTWAGIGIYPVTPGTDVMTLNTPMFEQVVLDLPGTRTLTVNTPDAQANRDSTAGEYKYITSAKLDGAEYSKSWLRMGDLSNNAVIDYTVGATPNDWASGSDDVPPSWRDGGKSVAFNVVTSGTYPGVMAARPGGTGSARLDAVRVEATESTYTIAATASHPGITLRDPGERPFNTAGRGSTNLVFEVADFVPSETYAVEIEVRTGSSFATETVYVRVAAPNSLESFRNMIGSTTTDAPRARIDTATSGNTTVAYSTEELDRIGFTRGSVHDVTDSAGVTTTFAWPGAPWAVPNTVNPSVSMLVTLDRPASRLSVIGAAISPGRTNTATLYLTNGTEMKTVPYDISFGDWKNPTAIGDPAIGGLDPAYGNTKVAWTEYNTIQASPGTGPWIASPGPYIFGTKSYVAPAGWKVAKIQLPNPGGAGAETGTLNSRFFALALDRPEIAVNAPTATAGGDIAVEGTGFAAGEPVTVTLETSPESSATLTANELGEIQGTVTVPRTAAIGTYGVTVAADSSLPGAGAEPASVSVTGTYTFSPTVSAPPARTGAQVSFSGAGFDPGESVSITLGGQSVSAVADASGVVSGTIVAPTAAGQYALVLTGARSGATTRSNVAVSAPSAASPTPAPTVTETVIVPQPGPTTTTVLEKEVRVLSDGVRARPAVKTAQRVVTLVKGQKVKIPAFGYSAAGERSAVSWAVTGKRIVSVSKSGTIVAKAVGKTTVRARYGGATKAIVVQVIARDKGAKVTSLTAKVPASVQIGSSRYIMASYAPHSAVGTKVTYKSGNASVLKVDASGRMVGVAPGSAKVTVTATDAKGRKVAKTYSVTVKQ
ncbi:MAG: GH92 family glycosyl hydrolase, partial [Bifidobacteriaceae bacterium]|nr:GH92 family glycosyl hydrolase [Bifidobacteriaceae bacterium]